MNDNDKNYNLIDRYFEGDLDSKELQDFQSKLAKNTDFAAAYEVEKNLLKGLESFGNQDLKAILQQIHQEEVIAKKTIPKKTKIVQMRSFSWLALAASFALLAVIAIWLVKTPTSSQDIFAAHYQTPTFETLRGGQAADLQAIQTFYKKKDYSQTIASIKKYLKNNPDDEALRLSLGISQLELGQLEEAVESFKNLMTSQKVDDQATWYLAMTYLKAGQRDLAKVELQKLVDGTVISTKKRQSEAAEILGDL